MRSVQPLLLSFVLDMGVSKNKRINCFEKQTDVLLFWGAQILQFRTYLISPKFFRENEIFLFIFQYCYSQAAEKFNSEPLHFYTQLCALSISHTWKSSLNSPTLSSPLAIQNSSPGIINICQHNLNNLISLNPSLLYIPQVKPNRCIFLGMPLNSSAMSVKLITFS